MSDSTVAKFFDRNLALLAKAALEAQDIPVYVSGLQSNSILPHLVHEMAVIVPAKYRYRAEEIMKEFEASLADPNYQKNNAED